MSYTQLFFNAVDFSKVSNKINFSPSFTCPSCKKPFTFNQQVTKLPSATLNFNGKVVWTCPNCSAKITLFVAVHDDGVETPKFCIQKSSEEGAGGIPSNWWVGQP